jgi:hypothetical protein
MLFEKKAKKERDKGQKRHRSNRKIDKEVDCIRRE